ncbi:MAG: hypothetical protein ACYDH8_13895, partial [Syntrophales bacterium]
NNLNILHLIFGPSLAVAQSHNPQRSAATFAVLFNRRNQIQPKSERNLAQVICGQALKCSFPSLTINSTGFIFQEGKYHIC